MFGKLAFLLKEDEQPEYLGEFFDAESLAAKVGEVFGDNVEKLSFLVGIGGGLPDTMWFFDKTVREAEEWDLVLQENKALIIDMLKAFVKCELTTLH